MRFPQVQYFVAMLTSIVLSFLLHTNRHYIEPQSKLINFLYFTSFSLHFGAQCWMTFVVGLLLFFNLPRIWFGHVQSKLFPIFFTSGFALSSITLATFLIQHKDCPDNDRQQTIQIAVLSTSVAASFFNAFVLSPMIIEVMIERFAKEKSSGKAYEIGLTDLTELKKDPGYFQVNKQFRNLHGLCGGINLLSLVANAHHMYYISVNYTYQ